MLVCELSLSDRIVITDDDSNLTRGNPAISSIGPPER